MPENQLGFQHLELAWKRLKLDIPSRVFVRNPFEIKIIEKDLIAYLENLSEMILHEKYYPKPIYIFNVPKGKGLVRPGAHLSIEDRIFYYACLGICLPNIYDTLKWSQGVIDFSYQISGDFDNVDWLKNKFEGWEEFRKRSLEMINANVSHVIIADITGYYENIDISILMSDLRATGASSQIIKNLSICLNRWAQVTGRGIPQGYSPSDILGKLYLNSIDLNLKAIGFDHVRYVDDIRIFCKNESQAKEALITLTELLRKRGLNLQSAKTKIHSAPQAKKIIDGVQPILQPILKKYISDIVELMQFENPYYSVSIADKLLVSNPNEAPFEVIRDAFNKYFIVSENKNINKTLFRFLINRLAIGKDDFALQYCFKALEDYPEETLAILKYIKSIEEIERAESSILEYINSEKAVYNYQIYLILEWFSQNSQNPSPELISFSRKIAFDRSQPKFLKPVSRKIVCDFGTQADLERIEQLYSELDNEKEKSECICCLKKMERVRRNSFLL